jgi:hypothetical protein
MGDDTSIRVSEELADELYQRKGRSKSYEDYIWELLEQVDSEPETAASVLQKEEQPPQDDADEIRERMKEQLAELEVPGRPAAVERTRREAVVFAWDRLREVGEVQPSRLADDVMGKYFEDDDLGYSVSKEHPGYQLLDNVLRDTVRGLPGVHSTGRVWQFREEDDV